MKKTPIAALFALTLTCVPNHAVAETPDIPEAIEQCVADLSQIDVPPPFVGISDVGPGPAPLAAVANWHASTTALRWIDPRSGISWEFDTLMPAYFRCRRLDRWGNTIAQLAFAEGSRTWSYWENTSRDGRLAITHHVRTQESPSADSTYLPAYELYIPNGADEIRARTFDGRNPRDDVAVGEVETRSAAGDLVVVVDDGHRLYLDRHGRLTALDYWPCGRTDPCTESPEKTEFFYDGDNNLTGRSYSYGGSRYADAFSLQVNERSDWVVRTLVEDGKVWRTRALRYFENGSD